MDAVIEKAYSTEFFFGGVFFVGIVNGQGRVCSWSYNSRIRNATLLFGVVAALEARSGPMREVIRKHFRLMKVGWAAQNIVHDRV